MASVAQKLEKIRQRSTGSKESLAEKILQKPSLEPYVGRLERFELFNTNQCYYIIGSNKLNTAYRIIKIDRTLLQNNHPEGFRPLADFVTEDPNIYTQEEIKDMIDMIDDGNRVNGEAPGGLSRGGGSGLKPIVKAYGIVGFIRFLDCYYLTLITKRSKCGSIGGNGIYTIKNTEIVPLKPAENPTDGVEDLDPSSVLLSMWNRGKRSVGLGLTNREIAELRYQGLFQVVDLSKGFYFSYTYDLTRSLQENFLATSTQPFPPPPFKENYTWNHFLTREFEGCLNATSSYHWIMPIIHGAFIQRKVSDYGRPLNLILIARRSRHFAGTRYLKRGVSEQGKVANDVEHEQILHDESESTSSSGIFSSYLQVRGSIPTFWTQESSVTMPKPPIELNRVDPTYYATRLHFEDLFKRYASPVLVLDLVKQSEKREREVLVGNEYRHAIDYINDTIENPKHKIRYCALDYSHISKHKQLDVSTSLSEVSTWAVNQTGFFCSHPKWKVMDNGLAQPFTSDDAKGAAQLMEELGVPVFPMEQNGVLRTNCIDCLDRTNVAQFSAGVEAVAQQLVVMGIRSKAKLDPTSTIVRCLIDSYVEIGDVVALQYGGSEAHKKVSAERSESSITPIGKHKELLTSIRRYYSNAFTDRLKQDAMNLFLGYFIPTRHSVPLWELENDYYLHNLHADEGRGEIYSMANFKDLYSVGMRDPTQVENSPRSSARTSSPFQSTHSKPFEKGSRHTGDYRRQDRDLKREPSGEKGSWWKVALQTNLQQRVWMRLPASSSFHDSMLPPKYERVYQPDKIALFDRFFARGWATPVRRPHSAQHYGGGDEAKRLELRRVISGKERVVHDTAGRKDCDEEETLEGYVDRSGYGPQKPPTLRSFVAHHDSHEGESKAAYIGTIRSDPSDVPEEYTRYLTPSHVLYESPVSYQQDRIDEFKNLLQESTLSSDDVEGIRGLAKSSHLGHVVQVGEYRGLAKDVSAIEVATAISEQFHTLDRPISDNADVLQRELERRGYQSEGVEETLATRWKAYQDADQQYSEVVDQKADGWRRSDLTTAASLQLYGSMFDPSYSITPSDHIFLDGKTMGDDGTSSGVKLRDLSKKKSFSRKAALRGVLVKPNDHYSKDVSNTLRLEAQRRSAVPAGFEQINDGMFASQGNKLLVLNGPAVDSWNGPHAQTKILDASASLASIC